MGIVPLDLRDLLGRREISRSGNSGRKTAFQQAVKRGDIELSGTYLNMTELPDFDLLLRNHGKSQRFAETFGHRIDSAMTADINGYSWGMPKACCKITSSICFPASIRITACIRWDANKPRSGGKVRMAAGRLSGTANIICLATSSVLP